MVRRLLRLQLCELARIVGVYAREPRREARIAANIIEQRIVFAAISESIDGNGQHATVKNLSGAPVKPLLLMAARLYAGDRGPR